MKAELFENQKNDGQDREKIWKMKGGNYGNVC